MAQVGTNGQNGSVRAIGPGQDERPEWVDKSHWPKSGGTDGMGGLPTFRLDMLNGRIAPISVVLRKISAFQKRTFIWAWRFA